MSQLMTMLLTVSVLTTLTTQAIKKVTSRDIPPNVLAAVTSCVLSVSISAGYIIYNEIQLTPQVIIEIIALTYLGFLCSTVGYDKVIQSIRQIVAIKEDNLAMNGDK